MKRGTVRFLLAVALVASLMIVALNSQWVLSWTVDLILKELSEQVSIDSVEGRLLGPIEIRGLAYTGTDLSLEIDRIAIDWQPIYLLRDRVQISNLQMDGIRYTDTSPANTEETVLSLPKIDLPVRIRLDNGQLTDIRILQSDMDKPIRLKNVAIRGKVRQKKLLIDHFSVATADFQMQLQGHIIPRGHYPVEANVQWAVNPTDIKPLAGNAQLSGDIQTLQVDAVLTRPGGAQLSGTLHDVLQDLHWRGELVLDNFDLTGFWEDLRDIRVSGRGQSQGTLTEYAVKGDFNANVPHAGDVTAAIDTRYRSGRVHIDNAQLKQRDSDMRVALSGQLDVNDPYLAFNAQAEWRNFRWPLSGTPQLESEGGALQGSGSLESYDFVLKDASIDYALVSATEISTQGKGTREKVELQALQANIFSGAVSGGGTIAWAPEFQWQANITGRNLDPATLQADWPGDINLQLAAKGNGTGKDFSMHADITELHGRLRKQKITGRGVLEKHKQDYSVSDLDVKYGDASLIVSGSLAEALDLNWQLSVPDLEILQPMYKGGVTSRGRLSGPRHRPVVVADVQAKDVSLDNLTSLGALDAKMNVDLSGKQHSVVDVSAQNLNYGNVSLSAITFNADGSGANHVVRAQLRQQKESLDLHVTGKLQDEIWHGVLQNADIQSTAAGKWTLNKPAAMNLSKDTAALDQSCWRQSASKLCLTGSWHRHTGWQSALDLKQIPLTLLQPLFKPEVKLAGILNGSAQLAAKKRKFSTVNVDLTVGPGDLSYLSGEKKLPIVEFNGGTLRVVQTKTGVDGKVHVAFKDGGQLKSTLHLPGIDLLQDEFANNAVHGRLDIRTQQLSIARLFYPELDEISGELTSNLALDGTLQQPRFSGQMAVRQASVTVPPLGLKLHEIELNAQGANDDALHVTGTVKSGEGSLDIKGELEFDPRKGSPGELTITGTQLQAVNLDDAKVWVSPDLKIKRKGRRIDVTGEIEIPRADIKAVSLPSNVTVSRDIVFVDDLETEEERQVRATRWLVHSDVKVVVGEDVRFHGYGLRGNLAGEIKLTDQPGKATVGQGALHITNGKFNAFGVSLNVDIGRIIFTGGPVDDPGIDARASRRSGDVTAGVRVSGRLKSPELSVFSIPSMPESEAMSFLLFGRVVRDTSFGANDLTQPESGAGVAIGTFLSPRIYVDYLTGVLNPTSVLRVRFQLTDRWELHTESASTHSAADAVFTFER